MSKVKLELQTRSFDNLNLFAEGHRDAMVGNVNFTTPEPTIAIFDASLSAYHAKIIEINAAEVALGALYAERGTLRTDLEWKLTGRGEYVGRTSLGDAAQILSAAFEIQADPSATTSIAKPMNVTAGMGLNPGQIDVGCDAVYRASTYIYEMREHSDIAAPGPWGGAKVGTRSSMSFTGLVSGQKYSFRVRALGPNQLESPWSDEKVCMAP